MQTMPEEWPSLTRMLSCRHSKKVSCETLSVSNDDSHSNLQVETQSFYYSDGEKDHMQEESTSGDDEANEIENPSYGDRNLANDYLQQARDLEKHSRKLDNPSYGNGKAAGHNFLARFFPFSKASHMPAASRAKEVGRLRKHLRTYPSAIRHTGGVLPHSGPILLHIGSLSGNSKAPATLRASSIIPRNAVAGKMNPSGAGEPSSPKVNCCGRVRNKQKHIGKSTSVAPNDSKEDQLDVGHASMLKRREKKKAHTKVVESASKKTSRMGSGNAMVADHPVEQSKETDCEKNLTATQNSGGKGSMSCRFIAKEDSKRWSLRETVKHEESNFSYQHQQNWQEAEASASSPEFPVDLSRFGSERGHEMMVANSGTSLVGNDSQRFEQGDEEDFVQAQAQAPPQNALLLIRNRKAKDNPEVASSSVAAALSHGQETDLPTALGDHLMNKITSTQSNMSISTSQKYDQYLPPLVEMEKPVTIADILKHTSSLPTEGSSSTACKSKQFQNKFSLPKEHSGGVHRQAPLPKPSPESSIWQRRAIEKPCALDIKKPMKAQIKPRTTI